MTSFGSIFPLSTPPKADRDDTAVVEQIDVLPGELEFDKALKAQLGDTRISRRIEDLEANLCDLAERLSRYEPHSPLIERAKILLKNRLEIDAHVTVTPPPEFS